MIQEYNRSQKITTKKDTNKNFVCSNISEALPRNILFQFVTLFGKLISSIIISMLCFFLCVLSSCKSSVNLTAKQKETISPEAQQIYENAKFIRIPFFNLSVGITERRAVAYTTSKAPVIQKYSTQYGIVIKYDTIENIPITILVPPANNYNKDVLGFYTHGGGFLWGDPVDNFALEMAHRLGIKIICPKYHLSPRAKYPTAVNECFDVYRKIVRENTGKKIILFGGSAGGNLALTTILKARDAAIKLPIASVLCTPWADLTGAGDAYKSNDGRDLLAWRNSAQKAVYAYAGKNANLKDPLISPIYADYTRGFPPCLITTGTRDLYLSNSVRLHQILIKNGVVAKLLVFEGMWHAFNFFPGIPEAEQCNEQIVDFLNEYLK